MGETPARVLRAHPLGRRRRRRAGFGGVLGLGCALLGGVALPARAETLRTATVLRVNLDATIAVRATVGDVAIIGWDRPDVEIAIVRSGSSEQALSGVASRVDEQDRRVLVDVTQASGRHDPALTGSVTVHVPFEQASGEIDLFEGRVTLRSLRRGARVSVARGSIDADSISGTVRLETQIGRIRVSRAELSATGMIRLRTFNGDVSLALASTPQHARIMALSLAGSIASTIPLTTKATVGPRFGEATLGRGEPMVSIDVVKGDIRITSGAP